MFVSLISTSCSVGWLFSTMVLLHERVMHRSPNVIIKIFSLYLRLLFGFYSRLRSFYGLSHIFWVWVLSESRWYIQTLSCVFDWVSLGWVFLQEKIVGCWEMIMFVVLNRRLDKLLVETHLLLHLGDQFWIDAEFLRVVWKVVVFWLVQLVKRMSPQSFNVDALFRVCYEDFCNYVLRVRRKELWELVVGWQNLFVQIGRFLIFIRQVSAEHCVKDYTDRPNVWSEAVVPIPSNHLQHAVVNQCDLPLVQHSMDFRRQFSMSAQARTYCSIQNRPFWGSHRSQ